MYRDNDLHYMRVIFCLSLRPLFGVDILGIDTGFYTQGFKQRESEIVERSSRAKARSDGVVDFTLSLVISQLLLVNSKLGFLKPLYFQAETDIKVGYHIN